MEFFFDTRSCQKTWNTVGIKLPQKMSFQVSWSSASTTWTRGPSLQKVLLTATKLNSEMKSCKLAMRSAWLMTTPLGSITTSWKAVAIWGMVLDYPTNSGFIQQLWSVRIWLLRELWDQSNTCDWFVGVAIQMAVQTTVTVEMRENQKKEQVIMTWRWNQQLHLQFYFQLRHRQLKGWWSFWKLNMRFVWNAENSGMRMRFKIWFWSSCKEFEMESTMWCLPGAKVVCLKFSQIWQNMYPP